MNEKEPVKSTWEQKAYEHVESVFCGPPEKVAEFTH